MGRPAVEEAGCLARRRGRRSLDMRRRTRGRVMVVMRWRAGEARRIGLPPLAGTGETAEYVLRLRHAGDLVDVALDVALRVVRIGVCYVVRALRARSGRDGRAARVSRETNVVVVAHRLLGEACQYLILLVPVALQPCTHVLQHLALNGRARVVKFWVETATFNIPWRGRC